MARHYTFRQVNLCLIALDDDNNDAAGDAVVWNGRAVPPKQAWWDWTSSFSDNRKLEDEVILVYPRSGLVLCRGLLLQLRAATSVFFGDTTKGEKKATEFYVYYHRTEEGMGLYMASNINGRYWDKRRPAKGVGLQIVRRLQRWWRGVVRWRERALAIMMCTHKRLGSSAGLAMFDSEMLRMITAPLQI